MRCRRVTVAAAAAAARFPPNWLQDGAGQVLSICFRLYCQNRGSPKVVSTAAATIRQAVALLFDHTVLDQQPLSPGHPPVPEGLASGREMAAMLLLQDLMNMCAGGWVVRKVAILAWAGCRKRPLSAFRHDPCSRCLCCSQPLAGDSQYWHAPYYLHQVERCIMCDLLWCGVVRCCVWSVWCRPHPHVAQVPHGWPRLCAGPA